MQYLKLLIVDDEEIIRKGLAGIVDWESLGYQVVATLEDGRSAMEYLDKMPVDVVLTDIKMTFVSGIELAKYIYEHKPEVRTVLISGYREFELARQAVNYNAVYYLLKPTNIDELVKVFNDLKIELNKERQRAELDNLAKEKYDEMQMFYITQFFTDLLMGAMCDTEVLKNKADLLNLGIDILINKCCIINATIQNYDSFICNTWNYGKEGLYNAIRNVIHIEECGIKYISLKNIRENIQILALELDTGKNGLAAFESIVGDRCALLKKCLNELIGIEVDFRAVKTFKNINEIANYKGISVLNSVNSGFTGSIAENCVQVITSEQKKLFLSYVSSGNFNSARNLMDNILNELSSMDIQLLRDSMVNLFALLVDKLRDFGMELPADNKFLDYNLLYKMKTSQEIKKWAEAILKTLTELTSRNMDVSENRIVFSARKYITENYNNDITLEDVAAHVFLSPVYFSRLFKQKAGENFMDYLLKIRMEKAKEILLNPEYKIYEVCSKVGYKSAKYFYSLFKNYTGNTPTEYRNNILKTGQVI